MKCKNISILYVEHEVTQRKVLSKFIKSFCGTIYIAKDGIEAFELYMKHSIDIVISAIKVPNINGIEMVKKMKEINPSQFVIFTTSHMDSEYLFSAIELEVNGYLTKPVDTNKLQEKILDCISKVKSKEEDIQLKESEERFRKIAQTAHIGICIYKEKFIYVNDTFCKITGYTREELFNMYPWNIIAPSQREIFKKVALRRITGEKFPIVYNDIDFITKHGEDKTVRASADTLVYEDDYAGIATVIEITDIVQLKKQVKLLVQAMEQMDEMVRITDVNGNITYVNEALTHYTGYKKSELIGRSNNIFKSSTHSDEFYKNLWDTILSKNIYKGIFVNKKKDGELYYDEQVITPIVDTSNGEIHSFISTGKDITKRVELEKKLKTLATIDTLTGISNRYQINKYIEETIQRVERFKGSFALFMFDIDHFKNVNDTYGHDIGDVVLQEFSQVIQENIRTIDMLGRWGGEEFLLISENISQENALLLAEKLREAVWKYNFTSAKHITVSIGVGIYTGEDTKELLLKKVDNALYEAKESGRNKVVFQ